MDEPLTWSTRSSTALGPGDPTPHSEGDTPPQTTDAGEARPGSFGRFVLLRELGRGGMGVVYTAYDHLLDRRVAIKVVRTDRSDAHGRILREAKALAQLSHPNVVQIYDVGATSSEQVYIAMELVDGVTLRARLGELAGAPPASRRREIVGLFLQAGAGLQAAHAAGLVHRDFKPDNVLVGADGRARVVDFGLVRASEGRGQTWGDDLPAGPSPLAASGPDLTVEGALLGTPLYMSPEHFAGQADDPRSDQFSFCAALYEALCGARPFAGESMSALRVAVLAGELRDAGGDLPAWLWAILRRGLSRRPADRFADMGELLAALASDPAEARRRRLHLGATVALAAISSVALVLGATAGLRVWQEHRRDEAAAAALASAEARIAGARAGGDPAAAARIYAAFVDEPQHAGTDAITRAHLAEAGRRRDDGDDAGASSALASAYRSAGDDGLRLDALVGLAQLARDDLDWDRLQRVLAVLDRDHPAAAAEPRVRALRVDAGLARGDYAGAAELLPPEDPRRPLIAALTGATRTPHVEVRELLGALDLDGDGARELLFSTHAGGGAGLLITAADPGCATIRPSTPVGSGEIFALEHDAGPLLVAGDGGALTLQAIGPGGALTPLLRRPDTSGPYAAASVDLDGDGAREVYVSTGVDLEILELTPDDDGRWRARVALDPRASLESAAYRLLPADLDADGRPELVAAFGGWRAHDLRLLGRAPGAPGLQARGRDKLGDVLGLAPLRLGGATGVLAKKVDLDADPLVFPPDRPRGAPPGLYFYAVDAAGDLRRADAFALPLPAASSLVKSWILPVGDLDGDGADDVALPFSRDNAGHTLLLRQAGGALHPQILAGVAVVGLAQLDDDPAMELLATLDEGGVRRLWALGVGDERPALAPPAPPLRLPALVEPDDPAWTRGWARAADLVAIGVDRDAADALDDLSRRSGSSGHREHALLAAAELRDRAGDHAGARDRYLAAADGPRRRAALRGALRAQLRLGEHDGARRSADALLALGGLDGAERSALRRLTAEAPRVDLTFEAPLVDAWQLHEPQALARDPESGALRVRTAAARGPLASLALEWPGGLLELEVDLTVRHSEWSSSLVVRVVPEGGEDPLVAAVFGTAGTSRGGQAVSRHYRCTIGRSSLWLDGPGAISRPDRVDVAATRAFVSELLGEAGCGLRREGAAAEETARVALPAALPGPGRVRLEIVASQDVPAWLDVDIHRITVQGARIAAAPPPAAFARAILERDAAAALAAAPPPAELAPRERLALADAILRLGQVQEAMSLWPGSIADAAAAGALVDLYRASPGLYDPLLRARYGAEYPAWAALIWRDAAINHLDDRRLHRDLLRALSGVDGRAAAGDEAGARIAELLGWRGRLRARMGLPEAARDDLLAALARLEPPAREGEPAPARERRALLLVDLAALEAEAGADELARARAREALAIAPAPLLIVDTLRARPALARIADALLGPDPAAAGPRPRALGSP